MAAAKCSPRTFSLTACARPQLALLMFGGGVALQEEKRQVAVDGWITFDAPPALARLCIALRRELDLVLREKMVAPRTATVANAVVDAAVNTFDPAMAAGPPPVAKPGTPVAGAKKPGTPAEGGTRAASMTPREG